MILIFRKATVWLLTATFILSIVGVIVAENKLREASTANYDYRVFVSGLGTVEGKWCGNIGVAIIGLETRPTPEEGKELKVIDLLVVNSSSQKITFNPDINLINSRGQKYGLSAKEQPEVVIQPGTMSQGTLMIDVPKGVPDEEWLMEVKGGNLKKGVTLPLRIIKAVGNQPLLKDE